MTVFKSFFYLDSVLFHFLFQWISGHVSKWNNNNNNLHFKMHFRICGILSILCYAWNIFHSHFQRVIRQLDSWKCNIIEDFFWNWHAAFYFEIQLFETQQKSEKKYFFLRSNDTRQSTYQTKFITKKTWGGEGTWVYLNWDLVVRCCHC